MLRILSLGAGVQSSTLALLARHGELAMPDCAIFADTQSEPRAVYDHLAALEQLLPFPVHRVTAGSLRQHIVDAMAGNIRLDNRPPFFTSSGAPLRRQCTTKHKIVPIIAKLRELAAGREVEQWIGISTDEAQRMKPSREPWITNRWPLIEMNMSRYDCLGWLERHGYACPPKSACTFCPYQNTAQWRQLKHNDPASFADAVAIDELIRAGLPQEERPTPLYVHYSCKPLAEVDFSTAADHGQLDLWGSARDCAACNSLGAPT